MCDGIIDDRTKADWQLTVNSLNHRAIVPVEQTGISTFYAPLGHYAWIPEDPARQIRSRKQGLPESPPTGLARVGFTRDDSLSAFYGCRFIAG